MIGSVMTVAVVMYFLCLKDWSKRITIDKRRSRV